MERGGLTREEFLKRLELQWPDEDKVHMADFVIHNNGTKEIDKIENKKIKVLQAFSLNVDQMRPKSRGKIQLNKNNIYGNPKLTFNYFMFLLT